MPLATPVVTRLVASFGYSGLLRPAPGTWGSLAAVAAALVLHALGGFPALLVALAVVVPLGWWATRAELSRSDDPDPSWIVIDEVAGMWIALLPVSFGAWHAGLPALALWPGWVTAFLAFRLFDIWKPGPIGWADRRGGATGVMLDDLLAGVFAACVVALGAALAHGVPWP
jgi:phosphatidylglycerophosphatase A